MFIKAILKKLHSKFNYTKTLHLGTKRFKIPIMDNMGLLNLKVRDSWFMTLVKDCALKPNMHFIDVGVNVGQTLIQYRAVSDAPYWGFEPNPACVHYLKTLIEKNRFTQTHIIPVGLSQQTSLQLFYLKHAADSAGTIIDTLRPGFYNTDQQQFVPVFEFDTLDCSIETVGLIKIDVEGAELEVLTGMQNTLALHRPPVICEILDAHSEHSLNAMQERAHQLIARMKDLNYVMYRINQSAVNVVYERIESIELKLWTEESAFLNDYLFWPATVPFIYN